MTPALRRALTGGLAGVALFYALAMAFKQLLPATLVASPVASQCVLKGALIVVALALGPATGCSWSALGFQRAAPGARWRGWLILGAAAMACASLAMVLLDARHPIAAQLTFLQIVTVVWIGSSVAEEVFVRGLVQAWMTGDRAAASGDPAACPYAPAVLGSAVVFGLMHVPLLWSGAGIAGGLVIVAATLVLGWACAVLRARTGSLWPAVVGHVLGNVGGLPGGVLGALLYRLLHGHLPAGMGG